MSAPITVVAVVGPTGVGKTALAIQLAQRFDGEIVNADSLQVYLGMDIGTAKPTIAEQRAARHHLIDIRAPDEPLSLGEYLPLARQTIVDINRRGKLPSCVEEPDSTYGRCLRAGRFPRCLRIPPIARDWSGGLRAKGRQYCGGNSTHWIRTAPRPSAAQHPAHHSSPGNPSRYGRKIAAAVRSAKPPYRALTIGLTAERSVLYDRIDARFDSMMSAGLLDEARRLGEDGYSLGTGPLASVGYSQLGAYLAGEMTLAEAIERAKTQTHRLVRRQYTWFKLSDERVVWLDAGDGLPVAEAGRRVADFLSE